MSAEVLIGLFGPIVVVVVPLVVVVRLIEDL
jgi:hypothetical protein